MRRRTQRIFITLLALFLTSFTMVSAYTFEVINWSPFWVLNLEKLILKQKPNSTWIILDWKEYTIKIDPEHESDWAIRVDTICDESWDTCKKVSELWLWGWSSITIDGNAENFCYKKNNTTLICNNEVLRTLIESRWLGWSINIDGQDRNYCYRLKDTNTLYCDNSDIPNWNGSAPGNGKITIMQWANERNFYLNDSGDQKITLNWGGTTNGAIAYWSGEYICVKNGDNLDCSKAKLGELKPDKRCTFDGTSINCNENKPSWDGTPYTLIAATASALWGIRIGYEQNGKNYAVRLDSNNKAYVNVPREPGQDGWIEVIDKEIWWRCKYGTITSLSLWEGGGTIKTGIICTYPAPTGWWDGLWTGNNYWTYPKNTEMSVAIWPHQNGMWSSSSTWNMRLAVNWNTVIMDGNTSVAKLGQNWVAFMGANEFYMWKITNTSSPWWGWRTVQQTYGVSVAWPIAIGYDDNNTWNYIYIYSEWSTTTSGRHFEIMWSNELAVWTLSGWFLYFNEPSDVNEEKYSIWVNTNNPKATLDVKWGIKVANDCMTCTADTYWTIIYTSSDFRWCKPVSGTPKWVSLTTWNPMSTNMVANCETVSFFHSATAWQMQPALK